MSNECLQYWANWAAIATFAVACSGVLIYFWQLHKDRSKRIALENYLRTQKGEGKDKGQRSILRIMRDIGLTQDEIIQGSFQSKHIIRRVVGDKGTGLATDLLFEYSE